MNNIFKYELGDVLRDTITGFTGVVVGRTEWQYGCVRYSLQPRGLKDGVPIESHAFDEDQLESTPAYQEGLAKEPKRAGGPKPTPRRF